MRIPDPAILPAAGAVRQKNQHKRHPAVVDTGLSTLKRDLPHGPPVRPITVRGWARTGR